METRGDNVWRLLAFVCRYGALPLSEAMHTDMQTLRLFSNALGEIIKEENTPRRGA